MFPLSRVSCPSRNSPTHRRKKLVRCRYRMLSLFLHFCPWMMFFTSTHAAFTLRKGKQVRGEENVELFRELESFFFVTRTDWRQQHRDYREWELKGISDEMLCNWEAFSRLILPEFSLDKFAVESYQMMKQRVKKFKFVLLKSVPRHFLSLAVIFSQSFLMLSAYSLLAALLISFERAAVDEKLSLRSDIFTLVKEN